MGLSIDFKKDLALDKLISLALALPLVMPFPPEISLKILIVTSYGHFALAHLYQWKRKAPSAIYLLAFFAALVGFWVFSYYTPIWPTVMVLGSFFFHCLWDEFKLTKDDNNILSGFLVITMVSTQILWLLVGMKLVTDLQMTSWITLSGLLLLSLCAYLYIKDRLHLTTTTILFGLTHIVFVGFYFAGIAMASLLVFRVLIHFHGISWYIEVGKRYWKTDKNKFSIYLRDVAIVNSVFIGGYFLYSQSPETFWPLEYAFYSVAAYYAWSMMHLMTTFRPSDYKNMISWPKMRLKA